MNALKAFRSLLVVSALTIGLAACTAASTASPAPGAMSSDQVLARVAGSAITLKDVDTMAASELEKLRRQEFQIRRQALDSLIEDALVQAEAKKKGITPEALLDAEVIKKVQVPSSEEIQMVYEMSKARIGDATLEQVEPQIRQFLMGRKSEEARGTYLASLRSDHKVEDLFEAPRADVSADDDAFQGPKDAPVTIITFSDFQCPYCSRAEETVSQVIKKYEGKVKVVFRDFPLEFHQQAPTAAMAATCAGDQGKYWEMHNAMFKDQSKLDLDSLTASAKMLGMDGDALRKCVESGKYKAELDKDIADGKKVGVTGTPAFFINGIPLEGAQPLEEFSKIIDAELARKK